MGDDGGGGGGGVKLYSCEDRRRKSRTARNIIVGETVHSTRQQTQTSQENKMLVCVHVYKDCHQWSEH